MSVSIYLEMPANNTLPSDAKIQLTSTKEISGITIRHLSLCSAITVITSRAVTSSKTASSTKKQLPTFAMM